MTTKYISLEEILRLHFQVVKDFGGSHVVIDEGRLGSVVEAPKQIVFGEEQNASLSKKAAVYLRNIIGDHPFSDGNKRTAVTVCGIFLARNGRRLTASASDLEDFTIRVTTDHLKIDEIASWLDSHSR